jgi:hypothetical protein
MAKGDGDAATWLLPNTSYRCAYVARQVAVKVSYDLWMTQAETNAIATILSSCPDEPLPGGVVAELPERHPPRPGRRRRRLRVLTRLDDEAPLAVPWMVGGAGPRRVYPRRGSAPHR